MSRIGFLDYAGNINISNKKKKEVKEEEVNNTIDHPSHYNWIPNFEVADITDYMNFNLGNCCKYIIRAGHKTENPLEDLKKAQWYLNREIQRIESLLQE